MILGLFNREAEKKLIFAEKKVLFMKKLLLLLLPILGILFCGCEEEEADLRFSKVSVSDPTNVKIEYYSVDPLHCSKSYFITANSCVSELTIKCTNAQSISLAHATNNRFYCEGGRWTATLVDSKTIKIVFDEITDDVELDLGGSRDWLVVQHSSAKEFLKESICVDRLYNFWTPLN